MAQDLIQYDALAREALRSVVREALIKVARDGLPGNHHFYITFKTQAPGVDIDPKLIEKFPHEMTIVLEHQFWDLEIDDDAFEVTLEFNKIPKYLRVPFEALVQFHDPSVNFGLRFDAPTTPQSLPSPQDKAPSKAVAGGASPSSAPPQNAASEDAGEEANVVSLDSFRKRPG